MKLKAIRGMETALRRLEDARDRMGKLAEEEPEVEGLARLHGLLSLDVGTLRGIIKRESSANN